MIDVLYVEATPETQEILHIHFTPQTDYISRSSVTWRRDVTVTADRVRFEERDGEGLGHFGVYQRRGIMTDYPGLRDLRTGDT
jgi:hypothetical protein